MKKLNDAEVLMQMIDLYQHFISKATVKNIDYIKRNHQVETVDTAEFLFIGHDKAPLFCGGPIKVECGYCERYNKEMTYAKELLENSMFLIEHGDINGAYNEFSVAHSYYKEWVDVPSDIKRAEFLLEEISNFLGCEAWVPDNKKTVYSELEKNLTEEEVLTKEQENLIYPLRFAKHGWTVPMAIVNEAIEKGKGATK